MYQTKPSPAHNLILFQKKLLKFKSQCLMLLFILLIKTQNIRNAHTHKCLLKLNKALKINTKKS